MGPITMSNLRIKVLEEVSKNLDKQLDQQFDKMEAKANDIENFELKKKKKKC